METEFTFYSDHFGTGSYQATLQVTIDMDGKGFRFISIFDSDFGREFVFDDFPEDEARCLIIAAEKAWTEIDWQDDEAWALAETRLDFDRENF